MNTSRTWTLAQVCELFQCTKWTIYGYVSRKKMTPFKKRPLTFSDDEVQRFMQVRKPATIQAY